MQVCWSVGHLVSDGFEALTISALGTASAHTNHKPDREWRKWMALTHPCAPAVVRDSGLGGYPSPRYHQQALTACNAKGGSSMRDAFGSTHTLSLPV